MELTYKDLPQNKYTKWYINIIENNKFTKKEKFKTEKHHIFPKSIFGENEFKVNLPHKEHFIVHLLLRKIYNGLNKYKMSYALLCFENMISKLNGRDFKSFNSKMFSKIRYEATKYRSILSETRWNEDSEYRDKQTKHNQEYWASQEHKDEQSERRKEFFINNPSARNDVGVFFKELYSAPEWKEKLSNSGRLKNSFHSEKSRAKSAEKKQLDPTKCGRTRKERYTKEEISAQSKLGCLAKEQNNPNWREDHANKIKGRIYVANLVTLEKRVVREVPEGFILWAELSKEEKLLFPKKRYDAGKSSRGTIWCFNPDTMLRKKVKSIEDIPEGWIRGRGKQ